MDNSKNTNNPDICLSFDLNLHRLRKFSDLDLRAKADQRMQSGDFSAAKAIYLEILRHGAKSHYVYNNLGVVFGMEGRSKQAIYFLRRAIEIDPKQADSYNNLGNCLQQVKSYTEAIVCFQKSLQIDPDQCSAYSNCGICYQEIGAHKKAISFYKKALSINPNSAEVYNNLGICLRDLGNFPLAVKAYLSAVRIREDYPEVYNNLGNLMQDNGKLEQAKKSYTKAVSLRSNYAEAHNNLAMLDLLHGNYLEGWKRYEYRLKCRENINLFEYMKGHQRWGGEFSCLRDRKILVCAEQGLGDSIQFSRYILSLQNMGACVVFVGPKKLHCLLESSGISAKCITPDKVKNYYDEQWIPLLSIPRFLQVTPNNPIIRDQYIQPASFWTEKWKKIFAPIRGRLVGINWKGNRSDNKKNERNFPPARIVECMNKSGFVVFSLQRGEVQEVGNLFKNDDGIVAIQDEIYELVNSDSSERFSEFAAMVKNLDLVVSSATTTSHLSAAMGVKTWTLVSKIPDWRWGLDASETFWYESMKIFRQSEQNLWGKTIGDVCDALRKDLQ